MVCKGFCNSTLQICIMGLTSGSTTGGHEGRLPLQKVLAPSLPPPTCQIISNVLNKPKFDNFSIKMANLCVLCMHFLHFGPPLSPSPKFSCPPPFVSPKFECWLCHWMWHLSVSLQHASILTRSIIRPLFFYCRLATVSTFQLCL